MTSSETTRLRLLARYLRDAIREPERERLTDYLQGALDEVESLLEDAADEAA